MNSDHPASRARNRGRAAQQRGYSPIRKHRGYGNRGAARRAGFGFVWGLSIAFLIAACCAAPSAAVELDLKQVVLFDSGVGYFERQAQVTGSDAAEMRFTSTQINDVIKSLLVLDEGGGSVSAVTYDARDPIDRTLKSFRVDLTDNPDRATLLNRLRGVPVRVRTTAKDFEGRVIGAERKTIVKDEWTVDEWTLNLATADGVRSISLSDILEFVVLDEAVKRDLDAALQVLASGLDREKKLLRLSLAGDKQRNVRAGYVLEMPVWKTSYRLEIKPDRPFLQGWAHVENTTDEDWQGIQMTLVSGRPLSFIQNLYDPVYVKRPVVHMESYGTKAPPVYADAFVAPEASGAFEEAEAPREKALRRTAAAMAAAPRAARIESFEGGGVEAMAAAREAGELFEYAVNAPVDLPRQKSAMIPIVNQAVGGATVSIFNEQVNAQYPLNGFELDNSTKLHLKQGPVTVVEDGVYAGDARLPDVQPGGKPLLSYGVDLARRVVVVREPQPEEIVSMKIVRGTLFLQRKYVSLTRYRMNNKKPDARRLILEHPVRPGWDLVEPARAEEMTAEVYRFRRDLPAGPKTTDVVIKEQRLDQQRVILSNLNLEGIEIYLKQKAITSKVRAALNELSSLQADLARLRARRAELENGYAEIERGQNRIRENMKAVARPSEAYAQWERKLVQQEGEIETLQKSLEQVRADERRKQEAMDKFLQNLDVE